MAVTAPIRRSLPQTISSMGSSTPRGARPPGQRPFPYKVAPVMRRSGGRAFDAVLGLGAALHGGAGILMIDDLGAILAGGRGLRLVLRHALLEGLDALRDVAHQLGDLAAAEQQQHHPDDDDPVPNA